MREGRWHRQALAHEVQGPDDQIDLARCALLIACEEYPGLDVDSYLCLLDELACRCRHQLRPGSGPYHIIGTINHVLFQQEGFRGNRRDYYDPENSYLNRVLERRVGIPITLSLVYMEVARRLGFPLRGVALPGHFIVKYVGPGEEVFIDPFHEGAILSVEECEERVWEATGRSDLLSPHHLEATTRRQMLLRLLHNLKAIYVGREDYDRALGVIELALTVAPWDLDQVRDRGLVCYHLGRYGQAIADLESYLRFCPDAPDSAKIAMVVDLARQRLAGESREGK
ncbi:MAG TPA: transglutaminase-like domain-containing protein [Dehalococcoidia bacterium]|nr:transglutaminase-like domain-containing protein [Dehalococcoidia bacterium]